MENEQKQKWEIRGNVEPHSKLGRFELIDFNGSIEGVKTRLVEDEDTFEFSTPIFKLK